MSSPGGKQYVLTARLGDGIAKLTLNHPPLNLVTLGMTEQLIEALDEHQGDEAVRAVVVTGAGDRAFCAGSDVAEFADLRGSLRQGREDSVRMTLELSDHLFKTKDCEEGITAFCEKREPHFQGATREEPDRRSVRRVFEGRIG